MKVGLFFGTFNPLHNGHLVIANIAINKSDIDQVWFVLTPVSPSKQKEYILDKNKRAQLIKKALINQKNIFLCKEEFYLPIPNYSVDTLYSLDAKYPDYIFKMILGQDNFSDIVKWKNYEKILENYEIITYPRKKSNYKKLKSFKITKLDFPLINFSSTKIRSLVKKGDSIKEYVPLEVEKEILLRKYYK